MPVLLQNIATAENFGVDASLRESHRSSLRITQHPVEFGADITDHAYREPFEIEVQGAVSNDPIGDVDGIVYGAGKTRSAAAWDQLIELQNTRAIFDVQTGLKLYRNMMLTSVTAAQDAVTGRALFFTARFREIEYSETSIVQVTVLQRKRLKSGDTERRGSPTQERGRIGPIDKPTDQGSSEGKKNYSTLAKMLGVTK